MTGEDEISRHENKPEDPRLLQPHALLQGRCNKRRVCIQHRTTTCLRFASAAGYLELDQLDNLDTNRNYEEITKVDKL